MFKYTVFSGLLDALAGQFYKKGDARCTGNDFAGQAGKAAQEFFSVVIVCDDLPPDKAVLGVLGDDSVEEGGKNTYTFYIFIDHRKIQGKAMKVLFSLILAHELCHFAFYYELFRSFGGSTSSVVYNKFKHAVSGSLAGSIVSTRNAASKALIDEHNMPELLYSFGRYPDEHFAKGKPTAIDYRDWFFRFLDHLKFAGLLAAWKKSLPA